MQIHNAPRDPEQDHYWNCQHHSIAQELVLDEDFPIRLYLHLLSQSESFTVNQKVMAERFGVSTRTIQARVKELRDRGLLAKEETRRGNGDFEVEWHVYEPPERLPPEERDSSGRGRRFPDNGEAASFGGPRSDNRPTESAAEDAQPKNLSAAKDPHPKNTSAAQSSQNGDLEKSLRTSDYSESERTKDTSAAKDPHPKNTSAAQSSQNGTSVKNFTESTPEVGTVVSTGSAENAEYVGISGTVQHFFIKPPLLGSTESLWAEAWLRLPQCINKYQSYRYSYRENRDYGRKARKALEAENRKAEGEGRSLRKMPVGHESSQDPVDGAWMFSLDDVLGNGFFQAGEAEDNGEGGSTGDGSEESRPGPDQDERDRDEQGNGQRDRDESGLERNSGEGKKLTYKEIMGHEMLGSGSDDPLRLRAARLCWRNVEGWFDLSTPAQLTKLSLVEDQLRDGTDPAEIRYEKEQHTYDSGVSSSSESPSSEDSSDEGSPDEDPEDRTGPAGLPVSKILSMLRERVFGGDEQEPGSGRAPEPTFRDRERAEKLGIPARNAMYLRWVEDQEYEAGDFDLQRRYEDSGPDPWALRVFYLAFPDVDLTAYQKEQVCRKVGQSAPCIPSVWAEVVLHGLRREWSPFRPGNYVDAYLDRIGEKNNPKTPDPNDERMSYMRILEGNGIDLSEREPYQRNEDPRESQLADGHGIEDQPDRTAPRLSPLVENDIEDVEQGETKRQSPPFSEEDMRPVEDQPEGEGQRWCPIQLQKGGGIDLSEKGWAERDPKHADDR